MTKATRARKQQYAGALAKPITCDWVDGAGESLQRRIFSLDRLVSYLGDGKSVTDAITAASPEHSATLRTGALIQMLEDYISRYIEGEREKKLPELFKHFGIAEPCDASSEWRDLALALAAAHVPGFKVTRVKLQSGRVRDVSIGVRVELVKRSLGPAASDTAAIAALPSMYPELSKLRGSKGLSSAHSRWKRSEAGKIIAARDDQDLKEIVDFLSSIGV